MSFYFFVVGLVCFIGVIVSEVVSLRRLEQQKMVLALIQGEMKVSHQLNMDIELSSEGEAYI